MDYLKLKELKHYGIKGQKWGVRRYQNEDGSLTPEGRKRYSDTVFFSGSSKTQDPASEYYRKELPKTIQDKLDSYMNTKVKFVVGDAPGIDRQVQDYLNNSSYKKVIIYGPNGIRYLANKNWKTKPIKAPKFEPGSKEWLAKKDIAMAYVATKGLAVILDEGSSATRKNIQRLIDQNKSVDVYELSKHGQSKDHWVDNK